MNDQHGNAQLCLSLLWRILVSTTDGKNVSIQPHDRESEKNITPAKDRLPETQNLRQISILMKLNLGGMI